MRLPPEEQTCRRKAMRDALTNARLEGLEPDPIFFEYVGRYVQGDLSLTKILADYTARLTSTARAQQAR